MGSTLLLFKGVLCSAKYSMKIFAFVIYQTPIYQPTYYLPKELELMGFFCLYKISLELSNRFLPATTDCLTFMQGFHNTKL